jgi:hypothetical protein
MSIFGNPPLKCSSSDLAQHIKVGEIQRREVSAELRALSSASGIPSTDEWAATMDPIFRATTELLTESRVLPATGRDPSRISDEYKRKLEKFLDQCRPQGVHSRLSSWFAFDQQCHAALFLEAEPRLHPEPVNATKFLYQVRMTGPGRHPMVVAEGVAKLLSQGKLEHATAAAKEYWSPTRDWKFWEYLSPNLKVVGQFSWPEGPCIYGARITYEKDKERCAAFFRKLHEGTPD